MMTLNEFKKAFYVKADRGSPGGNSLTRKLAQANVIVAEAIVANFLVKELPPGLPLSALT
jgi:hypothetical protein